MSKGVISKIQQKLCKHDIDFDNPVLKEIHEYKCTKCGATLQFYPALLSERDLLEVEIESLSSLEGLIDEYEERLAAAKYALQEYLKKDQTIEIAKYISHTKQVMMEYDALEKKHGRKPYAKKHYGKIIAEAKKELEKYKKN